MEMVADIEKSNKEQILLIQSPTQEAITNQLSHLPVKWIKHIFQL